jgi:uncharacterized protein YceK
MLLLKLVSLMKASKVTRLFLTFLACIYFTGCGSVIYRTNTANKESVRHTIINDDSSDSSGSTILQLP